MPEVFDQTPFTTGLDEAGRGALAGPVVAAAVCWPQGDLLLGLVDSKKISAKQREALFHSIIERALAWNYVALPAEVVDEMNVLQASMRAMRECWQSLPQKYQKYAIADGPVRPAPTVSALVRGDSLVPAISAASIVAKVIRDRMMAHYGALVPGYALEKHKGYGTAAHLAALKENRPSRLHRLSYAPVAQCL